MPRRYFTITLLAAVLGFSSAVWSYDAGLAESYNKLFQPVAGAKAGKALHMMTPEVFLEKVKTKEALVLLDVRTPAEASIVGATLPGSLAIPVNEVFTPANLQRIPADKQVVVLCKSGARATAVGTALRHIGFENVFILKGGMKALIGYMGPKEANSPPKVAGSK